MQLRQHHHLVEHMLRSRYLNPASKAFECFVIQDGICGIGKTTEALDRIAQILLADPGSRVMYVGVYLDELHRVAGTKRNIKCKDGRPIMDKGKPVYNTKLDELREFHHPYNKYGKSKLLHLKNLIIENKSVVVTHSLFKSFDLELIDLLKEGKYHLIIDEEPTVIESIEERYSIVYTDDNNEAHDVDGFTLEQDDLCMLEEINLLSIDKTTKALTWNGPELLRYQDVCKDVKNNHVDYYKKKGGNTQFFWRYNPDVFKCFKTAQLLTYLFKGSMFQSYLDINKIPYLVEDLTEASFYKLKKDAHGNIVKVLSPLHKQVQVYTPSKPYLTDLETPAGGQHNYYTSGYFDTFISDESLVMTSPIKTALGNFFKTIHNATGLPPSKDQKMWTTVLKAREALEDAGYINGFVPFNKRSTNTHLNATFLAYVYDPRPRPDVVKYIRQKGGKADLSAYSTSLLIQWVFRSALRDGKPIKLFIASPRMKGLFNDWLKKYRDSYMFYEEVQTAQEQALTKYSSSPKNITTDEFIKIQPGLKHIPNLNSFIIGLEGY